MASYDVLQCRRPRIASREGPFEVVKPDHVFVMGDNRDLSADSRGLGGWQVPYGHIRGACLPRPRQLGGGGMVAPRSGRSSARPAFQRRRLALEPSLMLRPSPWNRTARLARGGISWVTAFFLALLVGAAYLAWTWGPVYVVHYEVKQVVRDYMNQAVKEPNDDQLVQDMLHKLRVLDQIEMPDENGRLVAVPTVRVSPDAVTWERDTHRDPHHAPRRLHLHQAGRGTRCSTAGPRRPSPSTSART